MRDICDVNQAAASPHGVEDVGTNIVFHGVHNEGGVHGARKVQTKKGLVGSYNVNPVRSIYVADSKRAKECSNVAM
jgi:hypothetical protein